MPEFQLEISNSGVHARALKNLLSLHPDQVHQLRIRRHLDQLAAGAELHLVLGEAVAPVAPQRGFQVGVFAADRVADRHQHLLAGHATGELAVHDGLADLGREGGELEFGVGGDNVAGGEGGVVQVAAVIVADGLLFAGDLEVDAVAAKAGDADRGADGQHALAVFGVVAVADPAAVGAQVAAQKAVVLGNVGGVGQVGGGEQAQGQQGRLQTHRKDSFLDGRGRAAMMG